MYMYMYIHTYIQYTYIHTVYIYTYILTDSIAMLTMFSNKYLASLVEQV